MSMLEVKDLHVSYGAIKAVQGISFEMEQGETVALIGSNGAGKSTALNAVTQGVPYTGRVLFAGQDVAKMKPALRAQAIGVLAQNHFVGYGFTVEEVVRLGRFAYAGGLFGRSQTEDREKVEQALTLAGLQDKRRQSVLTLSGGEPMMQPEPLRLIAQAAKERGMNVWCYTGFTLEKLLEERREDRMRLLECVDVLVDGPYLSHERSLDLLYRGSKNQRLIDMPAALKAGRVVLYTPPEW